MAATTIATATHPRYREWADTWRWLGWAYEGDGPYLDGSALVPHPREVQYELDPEGQLKEPLNPIGLTQKHLRRRQLARFDNLAQPIVDTIADHQYRKLPTRRVGENSPSGEAYIRWTQDVHGSGTCLDDWLKQNHRSAFVFGYMVVTLERASSSTPVARSRADQGPLVLRTYTPLDMPDWIAQHGRFREVKLLEPVVRSSLVTAAKDGISEGSDVFDDAAGVEIRRWTSTSLIRYDREGKQIGRVEHRLGRPPVLPFYCRQRVRIPVIGRSLLGDPRIYRDHFNLVSEMRALLRDQTFSMLAIQLGENEDIASARGRLGQHSGTDSIIWHKGGATFISPSSGPVSDYVSELAALEDRMFSRVGLANQGDSNAGESGASRRIKAMDLDRMLAGHGDEAERFEYQLARLWFDYEYGANGKAQFDAAQVRIAYPDEYYVEQLGEKLASIKDAQGIGFGPTAMSLMKQSAIPIMLPNIGEKDAEQIKTEIEDIAEQAEQDRQTMRAQLGDTALDEDETEEPEDEPMAPVSANAGE